jgi:hypothetical protein
MKPTEEEVELFLDDLLQEWLKDQKDFTELYARHPKIRIGLRRALLVLRKRGLLEY